MAKKLIIEIDLDAIDGGRLSTGKLLLSIAQNAILRFPSEDLRNQVEAIDGGMESLAAWGHNSDTNALMYKAQVVDGVVEDDMNRSRPHDQVHSNIKV